MVQPILPALRASPTCSSTLDSAPATALTGSSSLPTELVPLVTTLAPLVIQELLAPPAEPMHSSELTTDVFATTATLWTPTESASFAATTARPAVAPTTTTVCLASLTQPTTQPQTPAPAMPEPTWMDSVTVSDQTATTPAVLVQELPTTSVCPARTRPL